jgi:hypothetical protein
MFITYRETVWLIKTEQELLQFLAMIQSWAA